MRAHSEMGRSLPTQSSQLRIKSKWQILTRYTVTQWASAMSSKYMLTKATGVLKEMNQALEELLKLNKYLVSDQISYMDIVAWAFLTEQLKLSVVPVSKNLDAYLSEVSGYIKSRSPPKECIIKDTQLLVKIANE